jgi:type IX secretion system substrate protein
MKFCYNPFCIILCLLFKAGYSQPVFQRVYTSGASTYLNSLTTASDGGYIISGNNGDSTKTYFHAKLDAAGQVQWARDINIPIGIDMDSKSGETNAGGYYFLATTNANNSYADIILVILDSLGSILSNHIYRGDSLGEMVTLAIHQKNTGEFYISSRYRNPMGDYYFFLKTDAAGNPLWVNTYGIAIGDKEYCFDSEISYDDGLISVGGSASNFGIYIVKTDVNGNLDWAKNYSDNSGDLILGTSIEKTPDGGYIIGGQFTAGAFGPSVPVLMKIDANGNFLWSKQYSNPSLFWIISGTKVKTVSDGGFIMSCSMMSGSGLSFYPFLIKTDSTGNLQWTKHYNLFNGDSFIESISLDKTPGNGFILSTTVFDSTGNSRGYIIKTDSLGNSGCSESTVNLGSSPLTLTVTSPVVNIPGSTVSSTILNSSTISLLATPHCSTIIGEMELTGQKDNFLLFPNPASATLNVTYKNMKNISITNLIGETLFDKTFSSNINENIKLDISSLAPGIYFIKAGNKVSTFVKE